MYQDMLDFVFLSRKNTRTAESTPTPNTMAGETQRNTEAVCPVDHKTRDAWLEHARAANRNAEGAEGPSQMQSLPTSGNGHEKRPTASTWGWRIPFFGSSATDTTDTTDSTTSHPTAAHPPSAPRTGLATDRVVSSIPRSSTPGPSSCPVNNEVETGADAASGNWVYPSERMFFEAMKRKGHDSARVADMKTVVPIHNAVNERAWQEIKEWEAPYTGTGEGQCGGPRLHSFTGLSNKMSPKARLNTLLGYTAPFDRHDWVVDRCGTRVDYVIDFYAGRQDRSGKGQGNLSFYLDVRPKLNTWEGVKMRAMRGLGLA